MNPEISSEGQAEFEKQQEYDQAYRYVREALKFDYYFDELYPDEAVYIRKIIPEVIKRRDDLLQALKDETIKSSRNVFVDVTGETIREFFYDFYGFDPGKIKGLVRVGNAGRHKVFSAQDNETGQVLVTTDEQEWREKMNEIREKGHSAAGGSKPRPNQNTFHEYLRRFREQERNL